MKKKLIIIGTGSTLIGLGINLFLLPSHLITGGVFGISLLMKYLWGVKLGITIACLNMPIYLIALKHNRSYFYNSLYGLFFTSLMIDLLIPLNSVVHLPIIFSALFGGITIGIGVGIMLRYNTCPGGIDLLAFLISKWTTINVGFLLFFIDMWIIGSGLFIFRDPLLIYSLITVASVATMAGLLTSYKSIVYIK